MYFANTMQMSYVKKHRECVILEFKRKERTNKSVKKIFEILSAT